MRRTVPISMASMLLLGASAADAAPQLALHRAVYDLSLRDSRGANTIERVEGRIVYEFTGSPCAGYGLNFRQVTQATTEGGDSNLSDLRSTTWEDDAAKTFKFSSSNFANRVQQSAVEGQGTRAEDGTITVSLSKPETVTSRFPATVMFPTEQLRHTIEAAERGDSTFAATIYDGSDNGQKAFPTLSVIGKPVAAGSGAEIEEPARRGPLAEMRRWPVSISYFDPAKGGGDDAQPVYTIAFDLFENGVSRALKIDYGDFVLDGKLTDLEFLPEKTCN